MGLQRILFHQLAGDLVRRVLFDPAIDVDVGQFDQFGLGMVTQGGAFNIEIGLFGVSLR